MELEEDKRNLESPCSSFRDSNMVSVSDITESGDLNVPSAVDMDETKLESLCNFEDDVRQIEYNLSWGSRHVSSFRDGWIDTVNMKRLIMVVDESIDRIGSFLAQNDILYRNELVGCNTLDIRLRRCEDLVRSFCSMSRLMQNIVDDKIRLLSDSFHDILQTIADEVCENDIRYDQVSDIGKDAEWAKCRTLKMEIIETENINDRIDSATRYFESWMKSQVERGRALTNELVVIDLGEPSPQAHGQTEGFNAQRSEDMKLYLAKVASIGFATALFIGIMLVKFF